MTPDNPLSPGMSSRFEATNPKTFPKTLWESTRARASDKESLSWQDKALLSASKSRCGYGSTAIAEISTSAPFFGRAAT